ncbi:HAMP domain-containing histidine kinase [Bacteroidales bacterium OttesenSCG-928-I14]|nr:HAMP domain-containing histidine kinase [Bacteroidales bacterium OttesenSCG-928-I14]
MKLPLKYITIAVIVSLSAIFAYQMYWLANMYHTNKQQAEADIVMAIKNADHIELFARIDSLSKENESQRIEQEDSEKENTLSYAVSFSRSESRDTVRTEIQEYVEKDNSKIIREEKREKTTKDDSIQIGDSFKSLEILAVQAQRGIHTAVDSILGEINLSRFDSVLKSDLIKANIFSRHYTDIVKLDNLKILNTSRPESIEVSDWKLYEYVYDVDDRFAYHVYVEPIELSILKQMSGILISSLTILIILALSFWFLIRTILKQKSLDEMKTDFTNNITHELKTPVAVAYAANDALLNFGQGEDKVRRKDYLSIVQDELQKLSIMIEQILSMSMERRKSINIHKEEIELRPLLESAIEQHKLKTDKPIEIELEMKEEISIHTDRTHFSNIVSNLIDNAIKYSIDEAKVKLDVSEENHSLKLSVSDRGIGIPTDKLKHIFDKFYRVPTGNKQDIRGYGLGLFYVKSMIEKLGGRIEVESEYGKGSRFIIIL